MTVAISPASAARISRSVISLRSLSFKVGTAIAVAVGVMMVVATVVDVAGISVPVAVGAVGDNRVGVDDGADAAEQPDSHSVEIQRMEMTSSEPNPDSLGLIFDVYRAVVVNDVCMVALP